MRSKKVVPRSTSHFSCAPRAGRPAGSQDTQLDVLLPSDVELVTGRERRHIVGEALIVSFSFDDLNTFLRHSYIKKTFLR